MQNIVGHHNLLAFFEQIQQHGQVNHAYLLSGPAHIGKRTLALGFAQALLCLAANGSVARPCGSCAACLKVAHGNHPDVTVVHPVEGKKMVGVDEIHELSRAAALQPQEGPVRVFIVPDAEMLTIEAANALLKTLEEPPEHTILLLTTTNQHILPKTILSRCQLLPMGLVNEAEIAAALQTHWGQTEERAQGLALLAAGRPGWAIRASQDERLPEQRSSWLQAMALLCTSGPAQRMLVAARLAHESEQVNALLETWLLWWHDLLLTVEGYRLAERKIGGLQPYADQTDPATVREVLALLQAAQEQLEQNAPPRLVLETLVLGLPQFRL